MSYIGVIVGICIVGLGVWYAQQTQTSVTSVVEETLQDPSGTPSPTGEMPSPTKTIEISPTKNINPTKKPTNTPIPNNTNTSNDLSSFKYPGASILSSTNTRLEMKSSDNPTAITNWYKEKINALGMNAKSFVTTNTNGVVVNKLVAAGNGKEIRVDITTSSPNSDVTIIVEI